MAGRRNDQFEAELGGLPYESSGDATPTPATIVVPVTQPAVAASSSVNATTSPASITAVTTAPAVSAHGPVAATPTPASVPVVASVPAVTASSSTAITATPAAINVPVVVNIPGVTGDYVTELLRTESTMLPDRIGVQPAGLLSDDQVTIAGASTVTGGTVLTGNVGFRGLFTINPSSGVPAEMGAWAILGSWGDATLKIRRGSGSSYEIAAEFVTVASSAQSTLSVEDGYPISLGLGVTRNATTGDVSLWRSDDGWVTWIEMPQVVMSQPAGNLPNAAATPLLLLAGGFVGGPWVQIFQAQWAETDVITSMDVDEVAAWNYGPNIITGLGGDYIDSVDRAVKDLSVEASRASYTYLLQSKVIDGGRTITVDWTMNVQSPATGDVPTDTASAFTYDAWNGIEGGPGANLFSSILSMTTNTSMTLAGRGNFQPQHDGTPPAYRVMIVARDGTPVAALKNAAIGELQWTLNDLEFLTFTLPTLDTANLLIEIPDTEVQVWVGDQLLMWCVVVRASEQVDVVDYQCRGLGWYFNHRIIGRAPTNRLWAGSWENGDYGWFTAKYAPTEPAANRNQAYWISQVTSIRSLDGTPGRSLHQRSVDPMTFGIQSITWIWNTIDPAVDPEGIEWTAKAWAYIPSDEWIQARVAAFNWNNDSGPYGLSLGRFSTTEYEPSAPAGSGFMKVYEIQMVGIDDDTPKDTWWPFELTITQPNDGAPRTDWIQIALCCPVGTVFWDEITLTRVERLHFVNADQADILTQLVVHSQDPDYGKSDLNIGTNCSGTGIQRTRDYDFFNHEVVSDCISEMVQMWKGVDWDIQVTPSTRTFTTYYPMKGSRRPAQALVLGRNIASVVIPTDGEQVANRVVVMSDSGSNNSSVEEAYSTDAGAYSSGLVLEYAYKGVPGSAINTLKAQAERGVRQYRSPVRIPDVSTYPKIGSRLLSQVSVGDVVPVDIRYGTISLVGEFRIIGLALDPATDVLTFTLNPFEEWNDPASTWGIP